MSICFNFAHIDNAATNARVEQAQDDHHQFCDPRQLHYSDPTVIAKIKEFHNEVTSLEPVKCPICLEQFPSISINDMNCCKRCHNDINTYALFCC